MVGLFNWYLQNQPLLAAETLGKLATCRGGMRARTVSCNFKGLSLFLVNPVLELEYNSIKSRISSLSSGMREPNWYLYLVMEEIATVLVNEHAERHLIGLMWRICLEGIWNEKWSFCLGGNSLYRILQEEIRDPKSSKPEVWDSKLSFALHLLQTKTWIACDSWVIDRNFKTKKKLIKRMIKFQR